MVVFEFRADALDFFEMKNKICQIAVNLEKRIFFLRQYSKIPFLGAMLTSLDSPAASFTDGVFP